MHSGVNVKIIVDFLNKDFSNECYGLLDLMYPYIEWFEEHYFEPQVISEECYIASAGVTQAEFSRVRATILAFAQFHLDVVYSMLVIINERDDHELNDVINDWYAPLLKFDMVMDIFANFSGIEKSKIAWL